MDEQERLELTNAVTNFQSNIHNLEISLLASNARLSLVEAFDKQMAQSQIEINEIVSAMIRQLNQLKASQNNLTTRLNELLDSHKGSSSASILPSKDISATLQKLRSNS